MRASGSPNRKGKHRVMLLGLIVALVVTGAPPLGGPGADAAKQDKHRGVSAPSGGAERGALATTTRRFENTEQRIGIIDGAGPVVSSIEVSGLPGRVIDVDVTLFHIYHGGNAGPNTNSSDDMDVLVVGPDGQSTLILSDVGGTTTTNVSQLVLDDGASQTLPDTGALSSGTFRPTNFGSPDPIPGAPTPPSLASLGVFNGSDPDGTWKLWAYDDLVNGIPKSGSGINGGWAITITTATDAPLPTAKADRYRATAGKTLRVKAPGVLKNDTNPDNEALTATLVSRPTHGRVTLKADGSFTYRSGKNAKGRDRFTYQVENASGATSQATVRIKIRPRKGS